MPTTQELPDCHLLKPPTLITPSSPTPHHALSLSNLDDQKFLRFSIKYLYLFRKSVPPESLKASLAKALVDYYPLAGRLRSAGNGDGGGDDDQRLEVDCNGEGAVFAEASMDITVDEFLALSEWPNSSWRKLLYKVEAPSFLGVPPLVVQVTNLRCGGMILCTAISHCLCDGVGTSQFLHAWAHLSTKPDASIPVLPFHGRHVLRRQFPILTNSPHSAYTRSVPSWNDKTVVPDIHGYLQSQPLIPVSITFTPPDILRLKRQCVPSLKCTSFEALATHTWRSWIRSLVDPSSSSALTSLHAVKLLFSVNVRDRLDPKLPHGYYGNGFVLGCAPAKVRDLVGSNLADAVKLVQTAKSRVDGDYVRSALETLEDKAAKTDLSASLVISQWSNLGLEGVDFGEGKAAFMGPLTSDVYCLFLPVAEEPQAVRVLVSVPERAADRFEFYMKGFVEREEKNVNGCGGEGDGLNCEDL
ncbi:alcohol acyltransferase 9 [Rhodamnia argentea]|uniref:Alcohol acyltransferase 9 n=1 Tax=Rhodamnia argentea TaxID=178133 RepID=A0A8B8NYJ5_9MYRT|nr:alcohol acyltransferase 9 [Rhodamnia argentea]